MHKQPAATPSPHLSFEEPPGARLEPVVESPHRSASGRASRRLRRLYGLISAFALFAAALFFAPSASFASDAQAPAIVTAEHAGRTDAARFSVGATEFIIDAPDGQDRLRDDLVEMTREEWPAVATRIGVEGDRPIRIHAERDAADYFARNGSDATPARWVEGFAISAQRTLVVLSRDSTLRETLSHELVHVAMAIASNDHSTPTWYNEGLAMVIAGTRGLDETAQVLRAAGQNTMIPLASIGYDMTSNAGRVELAYAQSMRAVSDLEGEFGVEVHHRILAATASGQPFYEAFATGTGVSFGVWERDWMAKWRPRFAFLQALDIDAIWGITGMLAAVLLVLARVRQVRKREQMPDAPHFVGSPATPATPDAPEPAAPWRPQGLRPRGLRQQLAADRARDELESLLEAQGLTAVTAGARDQRRPDGSTAGSSKTTTPEPAFAPIDSDEASQAVVETITRTLEQLVDAQRDIAGADAEGGVCSFDPNTKPERRSVAKLAAELERAERRRRALARLSEAYGVYLVGHAQVEGDEVGDVIVEDMFVDPGTLN